ncbi:hypothetical protein EGR_04014 [Echinococcus granulosus]|uniref:Uncharacterized protein n=1 Tax=Echinococcus granulosus TaxID=6210 RepID=W6UJ35_ECHGR|nr:hypothetical protein EGR_04014 [Echinococcus granulosus]EUB61166.1 hypothetical protein EGR_04014 [Echinococcus granulosus]
MLNLYKFCNSVPSTLRKPYFLCLCNIWTHFINEKETHYLLGDFVALTCDQIKEFMRHLENKSAIRTGLLASRDNALHKSTLCTYSISLRRDCRWCLPRKACTEEKSSTSICGVVIEEKCKILEQTYCYAYFWSTSKEFALRERSSSLSLLLCTIKSQQNAIKAEKPLSLIPVKLQVCKNSFENEKERFLHSLSKLCFMQ